jgi:ferredoxin
MNLSLDPTRCQGYGLCAEAFAAVELDEFGYAGQRRLPLADADLDAARAAVAACPNSALRIEK